MDIPSEYDEEVCEGLEKLFDQCIGMMRRQETVPSRYMDEPVPGMYPYPPYEDFIRRVCDRCQAVDHIVFYHPQQIVNASDSTLDMLYRYMSIHTHEYTHDVYPRPNLYQIIASMGIKHVDAVLVKIGMELDRRRAPIKTEVPRFDDLSEDMKCRALLRHDFLRILKDDSPIYAVGATQQQYLRFVSRNFSVKEKARKLMAYHMSLGRKETASLRDISTYDDQCAFIKATALRQIPICLDIATQLDVNEHYYVEGDGAGYMSCALALRGIKYVSFEPKMIGYVARELGLISSAQLATAENACLGIPILLNLSDFVDIEKYVKDISRFIVFDENMLRGTKNSRLWIQGVDLNVIGSDRLITTAYVHNVGGYGIDDEAKRVVAEIGKCGDIAISSNALLMPGQFSSTTGQYRKYDEVYSFSPKHLNFLGTEWKPFSTNFASMACNGEYRRFCNYRTNNVLDVDFYDDFSKLITVFKSPYKFKYARNNGKKIRISCVKYKREEAYNKHIRYKALFVMVGPRVREYEQIVM